MKKLLFTVAFLILVLSLGCFAISEPPETSCVSAVVYNVEFDQIIYEKNVDAVIFPASFTKIMTAVLALEYDNKPASVEVTHSAIDGLTGNYIGLKAGEIVPYDDLVKALIVSCGNDAALVLAECIGGSVEGFVSMMNEKAREIGMNNTHFTNPTGMHNNFMTSTLSDILILCKYAYHINDFMEISSLPKFDMAKTNKSPVRSIITRNLTQSKIFGGDYYDAEIKGMNSGSTAEQGFCLASTKTKNDFVYLCIVSGSKKGNNDKILSYIDSSLLYDYVFENYKPTEILPVSSSVCELPVRFSGSVDSTVIVSSSSVQGIFPVDSDIKNQLEIKETFYEAIVDAPMKAGTVVGFADVYFAGEKIDSVTLVTQADVERSNFLYLLFQIGEFFRKKEVVLTFLGISAVAVIYLIFLILIMPDKRKRR